MLSAAAPVSAEASQVALWMKLPVGFHVGSAGSRISTPVAPTKSSLATAVAVVVPEVEAVLMSPNADVLSAVALRMPEKSKAVIAFEAVSG